MNNLKILQNNISILEKDKERIDKIKKKFGYDKNVDLVPQCFWGNIKNPKVIILANNPSYVASDELDNKYFRKTLLDNLEIDNRDEGIINVLFSSTSHDNIPFELSGVSKWWRDFFDENINPSNKDSFMSDKCIINLCGYYKTNVDEKIDDDLCWFYDENKQNKINDILENVLKNNENLKKIITVWSKNGNQWLKVLNTLEVNINVEQAEKKNPYRPYLKLL